MNLKMTNKKDEIFKLTKPDEYQQWRYLHKQTWSLDPKKEDILKGVIDMGDRDVMLAIHGNTEKAYLIAEKKMKIAVVKTVSSNYEKLILHQERFVEMWQTLEDEVLGERKTRLINLTTKIRNLEWRGSLKKLLSVFNDLVSEYRRMNGSWTDGNLADELIRALPEEFDQYVLQLRRELKRARRDHFYLKDLVQDLELGDTQLSVSKSRRSKKEKEKKK